MTALEVARAAGGRLVSGNPRAVLAGFCTDLRSLRPGGFFVALPGGRPGDPAPAAGALRAGAAGVMVSPLVASNLPSAGGPGWPPAVAIVLVEDPLRALGALAGAWRERHGGRVVAVAGSNGKSTTHAMLRAVLGASGPVHAPADGKNDLAGVPQHLLAWPTAAPVAILELEVRARGQMHRLGEMARPEVGVFTTVGEADLEDLGSIDEVARALGEMLPFLEHERLAVINLDDPHVERFRTRAPGRTLTYGLTPRAEVWASDLVVEGWGGTRFTLRHRGKAAPARVPLPGRHNVRNGLAAAAVGFAWGLPTEAILAGLGAAPPSPLRPELVRLAAGARAIVDCRHANPASVERALETFAELRNGERAILVLGDMRRLGRHSAEAHRRVGASAARTAPDLLIAVGPESRALTEGAVRAGLPADRVHHCDGVAGARERLRASLTPDTWVLVKTGPDLGGVLEGL
jgi:UDP-N-acetylmuramoyl-tripeptide--D-alanyl-D-alanine ligase